MTRILDWHHCAKKAYNSIFTFLSAVGGCLQATFRWAVLLGHLPAQLIMTSKLIVFSMCHSFFVTFFNKNFVWSPVCKKKKSYYKAEADKNIRLPRSHKSHLTNILTCILLTASTSQNCSIVSEGMGTSGKGNVWHQSSLEWSHDLEQNNSRSVEERSW